MQYKGIQQFGCNKWLDLLTADVLNGFYCICRVFNILFFPIETHSLALKVVVNCRQFGIKFESTVLNPLL